MLALFVVEGDYTTARLQRSEDQWQQFWDLAKHHFIFLGYDRISLITGEQWLLTSPTGITAYNLGKSK